MGSDAAHGVGSYIKIYFVLLFLLIVSILGPELEIPILTLITAFGIAIVKALMVAAYFMHLNIEKRYIWYLMFTMLLLVGVFFSGVMSDIMRVAGANWENTAAQQVIEDNREAVEKLHQGEAHP